MMSMPSSPIVARAAVRLPSLADPARREPLTFGVPIGRGRLVDETRLVAVSDRAWPTDARALERWPDGSIRWALVDVHAELAGSAATLELRDDVPPPEGPRLEVTRRGAAVSVTDGTLALDVDPGDPRLLVRLEHDGVVIAAGAAPFVAMRDATGAPLDVVFSRVDVEHEGRLRVVLRAIGTTTVDGGDLAVAVRLTLIAGWATVGVELALHNPRAAEHPGGFWDLGDPGSMRLRSAGLVWALPSTPAGVRLAPTAADAAQSVALPCAIVQQGSGGPHWTSRVHVNRDNVVALDGPGFVAEAGGARTTGDRAHPWLACDGPERSFVVTATLFWQLFPKGVEVDAGGRVTCWSLPPGGDVHEIQAGERCDCSWWISCARAGDGETAVWCRRPSTVLPEIAAVAEVEALPALLPVAPGVNDGYEALVAAAIDGDDGFLAKRERIDEYGWRHYGDLYADHENGDTPGRQFVSHYNNQYDAVLGLTLQALRHDDHRWWQQAADLARHVARIDVYWTTRDRAAYNGGLFWHTGHYTDAATSTHRCYPRHSGLSGGGPSNEHCYSTGLLLHHLLTGDPVSRDAVVSLGEWMIAIDDGRRARFPLPWLSHAPTGGASATVSPDYHGPGRGPANAVLALLNAYRVTGDPRFTAKAEVLVRRVVHPDVDPASHELLDVERRWSYTVMLQALGRCLFAGVGDAALADYMRAVLLRYARWMADHEYCYLDKPALLEFPTETWAAQDLRKSEVFDLAAWHASTADERERFLERARDFHARSIATLSAMPTRTRTRPLVLLLQYGYARTWFERVLPAAPLAPAPAGPWPARVPFVPQRAVAKRRLMWLAAAGLAGLAGVAVALVRWAF